MLATLAVLCLCAAPEWAAFPPDDPNQWKPVPELAKAPAAARKCLAGASDVKVYRAPAPRAYFVAGRASRKAQPAGTYAADTTSDTVALLRADGTCTRVFTCEVSGDGPMATVAQVRVNAQQLSLFLCEGQADNYRFYQVRIGDGVPAARAGESKGDLDVADPFTGEAFEHDAR